jgi:hypothetical protein
MAIARMIIAETIYRSFDYSKPMLGEIKLRTCPELCTCYLPEIKNPEKNGKIQMDMQQNVKR